MKKQILSWIGLFIILFITDCDGKKQDPIKKVEYSVKYFKKQRWCSHKKQFNYTKPILNKKEENMTKYYKVSYYKDSQKIAIEAFYKKKGFPARSWYYSNSKGLLIKEEVYKKGDLVEEFDYKYDNHLNKKEESHYVYKPDKRLVVRSFNSYNYDKSKKGLLVKIENYNAGNLDEYFTFEYDSKGRVSKKSVYFYNDQLTSYNIYSYNINNLKIKENIYHMVRKKETLVDVLIRSFEYDYNEKHLLKEKRLYEIKGKDYRTLISTISYQYNPDGKRILTVEWGKKRVRLYEIRYFYDKNGCKKMEKRFDGKRELIETIRY